jgi:hypothetical protein
MYQKRTLQARQISTSRIRWRGSTLHRRGAVFLQKLKFYPQNTRARAVCAALSVDGPARRAEHDSVLQAR